MAGLTLIFQIYVRSSQCVLTEGCGLSYAKAVVWSAIWPASWFVLGAPATKADEGAERPSRFLNIQSGHATRQAAVPQERSRALKDSPLMPALFQGRVSERGRRQRLRVNGLIVVEAAAQHG